MQELAAGHEPALHELLRRYERSLAGFLYRHRAGEDVDDLFQETWLRIVRNAHRFDPGKRFTTWMYRIALNLCRDRARRRGSEHALPLVAEPTTNGPERRVAAGLDARRLLAMLPEAQREVLILRHYHDMSEEETAAIVGIPVGTVKSRLHLALKRLHGILENEE